MMSSRLLFFILLCGIAVITSCAGKTAPDIVNYVNQGIIAIAELEQKSLASYESVAGEKFTTDQKLIETLKDFIIPTYKRFVSGLKKIDPENSEVRRVHAIYIRAAASTLEGFQTIMVGCENDNERVIIQGNEKIEQGRIGIEKWRTELNKLYKKHGVAEMKG